jgi:hypothetical protein
MLPIPLCPQSFPGYSIPSGPLVCEENDRLHLARVNDYLREFIRSREEQTVVDDESISRTEADIDPFLRSLKTRWPPLKHFRDNKISSLNHPFPANLVPLDECILAIFWEGFNSPISHRLIGSQGDLVLLRAAALYQATIDTVGRLL